MRELGCMEKCQFVNGLSWTLKRMTMMSNMLVMLNKAAPISHHHHHDIIHGRRLFAVNLLFDVMFEEEAGS
jgi:hypothetical protein